MEVKARFLPKLKFDDAKIGLFGAGLQYDFTKMLPADKILPVAISAVIGYTNLNGEYDFTELSIIDGSDQRVEASFNTWNFSAVVSTRNIPVINFYGGIGYITGKSDIDFLGTYEANGPFFSETVVDPFSVSQNASGASSDQDTNAVSTFTPSKIILTGEKKKTLHREELNLSETERVLKTRTEHHAAIMQKRRSGEGVKKTAEKEAKVPKQLVLFETLC